MKIEEQIRIGQLRSKLNSILVHIAIENGVDALEILSECSKPKTIQARQMFISVCHLKLNFNYHEIASMIGISENETQMIYLDFLWNLKINKEFNTIYKKVLRIFGE